MPNVLRIPVLTRARIWAAFGLAVLVDGIQFLLGGVGWFGPDEVLDVITMVVMTALLGFHPLFLPTFVIELIPGLDMAPTWIGCVAVVVALRRRKQPPPPPQPPADVIDI